MEQAKWLEPASIGHLIERRNCLHMLRSGEKYRKEQYFNPPSAFNRHVQHDHEFLHNHHHHQEYRRRQK